MSDHLDRRLDKLFQSYREACPDIEGSPEFMPRLWRKIEARQRLPFTWRRITQVFVSAAAALCLVMSLLLLSPVPQGPGFAISYLEALDSEHELMAFADLDPDLPGDLQ
ncbi:MAG: hypothetical protein HY235_28855 [Acidobacteria bacterium]|nr:hypothetical protein [Acidobacteriota bacterium]